MKKPDVYITVWEGNEYVTDRKRKISVEPRTHYELRLYLESMTDAELYAHVESCTDPFYIKHNMLLVGDYSTRSGMLTYLTWMCSQGLFKLFIPEQFRLPDDTPRKNDRTK